MTGPVSNQGPLTNGKQTAVQDSKSSRAKSGEAGDSKSTASAATLSADAIKLNGLSGGISSSEDAARVATSIRHSFASNGQQALAAFGHAGDAQALQRLAGE